MSALQLAQVPTLANTDDLTFAAADFASYALLTPSLALVAANLADLGPWRRELGWDEVEYLQEERASGGLRLGLSLPLCRYSHYTRVSIFLAIYFAFRYRTSAAFSCSNLTAGVPCLNSPENGFTMYTLAILIGYAVFALFHIASMVINRISLSIRGGQAPHDAKAGFSPKSLGGHKQQYNAAPHSPHANSKTVQKSAAAEEPAANGEAAFKELAADELAVFDAQMAHIFGVVENMITCFIEDAETKELKRQLQLAKDKADWTETVMGQLEQRVRALDEENVIWRSFADDLSGIV
ncbi:hypothetical protein SLS54_007662 [Diplodia seriata]